MKLDDPKTWPLDIICPLERGEEKGFLLTPAMVGFDNQFRVIKGNYAEISDFRTTLEYPHEQYSSAEEILSAGWSPT